MTQKLCVRKLKIEMTSFLKCPPPYIPAVSVDERNMLDWHYLLQGPPDTPYEGGWYIGKLRFPEQYPFKPPAIMMMTPSGRFKTGCRLCLSMSDFHPETWNPSWTVASILTGLLSFMVEDTVTAGSITTTEEEKRQIALESGAKLLASAEYLALFPQLPNLIAQAKQKQEQLEPGAEGEATGPSANPSAVASRAADPSPPTSAVPAASSPGHGQAELAVPAPPHRAGNGSADLSSGGALQLADFPSLNPQASRAAQAPDAGAWPAPSLSQKGPASVSASTWASRVAKPEAQAQTQAQAGHACQDGTAAAAARASDDLLAAAAPPPHLPVSAPSTPAAPSALPPPSSHSSEASPAAAVRHSEDPATAASSWSASLPGEAPIPSEALLATCAAWPAYRDASAAAQRGLYFDALAHCKMALLGGASPREGQKLAAALCLKVGRVQEAREHLERARHAETNVEDDLSGESTLALLRQHAAVEQQVACALRLLPGAASSPIWPEAWSAPQASPLGGDPERAGRVLNGLIGELGCDQATNLRMLKARALLALGELEGAISLLEGTLHMAAQVRTLLPLASAFGAEPAPAGTEGGEGGAQEGGGGPSCQEGQAMAPTLPSPATSNEVLSLLSQVKAAIRHKARGNEHFRKGNWAAALKAYDSALASAPSCSVLHCNRAAALAGLGR
eukprot:TRINITY_DN5576_c0_g1_i2.p1 TRINITY_DN5576_c0_g1~~TRINITY_DN5576_c0_g1_i2.p1  ORF type:complete len:679 (+),score=155.55 TRINITY_DN5576_c0_g1_i2:195-2231(+)